MRGPRGLLALISLEGLIACLGTLLTPSESGRAVLLWLSAQRLILLALMLALWLGLVGVTLVLWRSPRRLTGMLESIDDWCLARKHLAQLLLLLFVLPLLLAASALVVLLTPLKYTAYQTLAPATFPLLHALVAGILPLGLLLLLISLEVGVYLAWRYRSMPAARETWSWIHVGPALLLLLILVAAVAHWFILGFQLRFFVNIPAWYWKFAPVSFSVGDVWFALGVLALLAASCWIITRPRGALPGLILIFALGWVMQIGVGLMGGGGLASLVDRYFTTYHKAYVQKASQYRSTLADEVQHYEALFGSQAFTSTKPPGLMGMYIGLDHWVNGFPSAFSDDQRYQRLATAIELAFPVLAACMVFLIYAFARRFLDDPAGGWAARVSPLLYVLCPNAVLFSFFPDQAIYPLVFLLGVWFIVLAIRRRSLIWSFAAGLLLYLAVFFAFTMLPLYPFAGIYLLLDYWANRSGRGWQEPARMAVAIAAGTLVLYGLFALALNYNFLPRFEKTMAINHNFDFYLRVGHRPPTQPESVSDRLGQIGRAAWVNNLDFAAAVGFPIYILFIVQGLRLLKRQFTGRVTAGESILATLLLSFVVLNLAGTAQGEVPRLWLFWLPMMVILAALEIRPWVEKRPWLLFGLGALQFITVVLTFHFQDLRM
jgi:hypothetical protein